MTKIDGFFFWENVYKCEVPSIEKIAQYLKIDITTGPATNAYGQPLPELTAIHTKHQEDAGKLICAVHFIHKSYTSWIKSCGGQIQTPEKPFEIAILGENPAKYGITEQTFEISETMLKAAAIYADDPKGIKFAKASNSNPKKIDMDSLVGWHVICIHRNGDEFDFPVESMEAASDLLSSPDLDPDFVTCFAFEGKQEEIER